MSFGLVSAKVVSATIEVGSGNDQDDNDDSEEGVFPVVGERGNGRDIDESREKRGE